MITNFGMLHGSRYDNSFQRATMAERILVDATTRTEYVEAIGAMRGALETILKENLAAAKVTDEIILALCRGSKSVGLNERIRAVGEFILNDGSDEYLLNNMTYIRKWGNEAVHGGDGEAFPGDGIESVRAKAIIMYEDLFEIAKELNDKYFMYLYEPSDSVKRRLGIAPAAQQTSKKSETKKKGFWSWGR